jgi:rubredoxin
MDGKRPIPRPERCPDCGSVELVDVVRNTSLHGEVRAWMCRVCDWASDPRVGRPAADRSKNFTLRRLLRETSPSGTQPARSH